MTLRHPVLPYAIVTLLSVVWTVWCLSREGISPDALLELTRLTARTSVFFFLAAFSASALLTLTRSIPARFMTVNRRHIGLAFALSHAIHLGALVSYFAVSGERPGPVIVIAGGLAYLFIAAMAATSNTASQRWLGRNWRCLHLVGSWYIGLIFLNSYLGRVQEGREPVWMFGGILALLLTAAALRLVAGFRQRMKLRSAG